MATEGVGKDAGLDVAMIVGDLAASVARNVSVVLGFPFNANERVYVGYLLATLVLASAVYLQRSLRKGPSSLGAWWRYLFSSRIWWHPSARLDYQVMVFNPIIQSVLVGAGLFSVVKVAMSVSDGMGEWLGPPALQFSPWTVSALFTAALFIADDFTRYWLHRMLHRVPWLWALHKLHHSAEVLTPATVYRIHPLESFLYASRMALTQGVVIGVFVYGFGMRLSAWDIAGANLFTFLFNLSGANLRHSHIRLSYGPWLERLLISPAQHQIHHSNRPEHFDRNYGAFLAIWDGLFGTLTLARGQRRHGFGLRAGSPSPYSNLWQAYWLPVAEMVVLMTKPVRRLFRYLAAPADTPALSNGRGRPLAQEKVSAIDNEIDSRLRHW